MAKLELWGGHECTVNRVGDTYGDQSELSGHTRRSGDIDLFASLGIAALRYPVLWEKVMPDLGETCLWERVDEPLVRLRASGMRVIAGLVHHGSGPMHTSLLDKGFAEGLASYAGKVAERYPWIMDWTPVNEPLTTARFSALYGHWYPHKRDEGAFWLALLNQIDGVRLSMQAIRRVNPSARLIQTDDLGRTYATAPLREQAGFENMRRWASWDLLCGRVSPEHPLWARIARYGLEGQLRRIADNPVPPDIIGINHYITSERFLDHRLQRYPAHTHGGNGDIAYADVECARVLNPATPGLAGVLREAWARYRIPLAVTEVHNGCTRDEQMRWMAEAWDTADRLREEDIDICAATCWSLLGSNGWNTLLTAPGIYEPGVFDLSGGTPRATALATLLQGLPNNATRHPVVAGTGWWRRPIRLEYPAVARPAPIPDHSGVESRKPSENTPPLLICGAAGTLGQAFSRACRHRDIRHVLMSRKDMAIDDPGSIARALDMHRPWAVINAAGWVRVDDAENDPAACFRANTQGARLLSEACGKRGIQSVNFSTDLVFNGRTERPYVETDIAKPLNVYGHSKAGAEAAVAAAQGSHLVIRTAAFFSPDDAYNFAVAVVRALKQGIAFQAAEDYRVSPTYVPDLVNAALDLLIDGADGIWHLSNHETLSWADFARKIAEATGLNPFLIQGVTGASLGWRARRPVYAGLASSRGGMLPPLDEAVARFAIEITRADLLGRAKAA